MLREYICEECYTHLFGNEIVKHQLEEHDGKEIVVTDA